MPKHAKQQEKPNTSKPYTRVTPYSLNRFSYFHAEDKTNLTSTGRGISNYSSLLGIPSLKKMIMDLAKEKGRKITILDSGCGECVAIDELLSDNELEPFIQSISGVSLHYFENVEQVMKKHPTRFYYYLGATQRVLSRALETHNSFDLILDMWGAYPYSENKLELLKQYHQALLPHGIAHIYRGSSNDMLIQHRRGKQHFSDYATQDYPETFSIGQKIHCLSIKKSSARWPLPSMNIVSSEEIPAVFSDNFPDDFSRSSMFEALRRGNAIKFNDVVVELTKKQPMGLRPLAFSA